MNRALLLLSVLLAAPALAAEDPAIRLPDDPRAVVLSLEHELGLAPPRKMKGPLLSVLADGTVRAPDVVGGHGVAEHRLSKADLGSLLRFVVVDQKLLAYDEKAVRRRIREDQERGEATPLPPDGATIVIRVTLADRSVEVRHHGLEETAKRHPGIADLARAVAVARRLAHLRYETIAGGPEALRRYLGLVNAARPEKGEGQARFVAAHLAHATFLEGGGHRLRFMLLDAKEDRRGLGAIVIDRGKGDPEVSVYAF